MQNDRTVRHSRSLNEAVPPLDPDSAWIVELDLVKNSRDVNFWGRVKEYHRKLGTNHDDHVQHDISR